MDKLKRIAFLILLSFCLLHVSCDPFIHNTSQKNIDSIANPYKFSITKWEISTLGDKLWGSLKPARGSKIDDVATVQKYLEAVSHPSSVSKGELQDLEDRTERILAKQIREALIEEGIINPVDSIVPLRIPFPPVNFEFELPPSVLIVSPRDEIKLLRRRTLEPNLSIEEKEEIESQVDALGYSSLVTNLGGVGFTYPAMVIEGRSVRRTLDIAVEEWFHQYMFFHPLGFMYALDSIGWRPDTDIITMNETVAGIVSKEIAGKIYQKYYTSESKESPPTQETTSEFDILMREIRIEVDRLLAQGKIEEAEEFMRNKRDFLESKGYYIRKLNQAYFAFYGAYADEPTTVSPIGQDLQKLRAQSSSLNSFLSKVKWMTSYEDLKEAVRR